MAGLFGLSPAEIMQQRNAALQAQAQQYAQLDPLQRAASSMYQAGARLGGAVGGMFGLEDPALKRAKEEQQLAQGVDTTSLEGLKDLITKAQAANNPQLASRAFAQYQALEKQQAELGNVAAQAKERGSQAALHEQQRLGLISKEKQDKLSEASARAALSASGVPEEQQTAIINNPTALASYLKQIDEKTAITEANGRVYLVEKNTGKVIKDIGSASDKSTKITVSPEIKMTNQEIDWRKNILAENKPLIEQASNVRQALNLLEKQDSPFATAAFSNTVVSAFGGDKQKSKSEIERLVNTGSLDQRVGNTLLGFFEGTKIAATVADQKQVLQSLDKALEARYNASTKPLAGRLNKLNISSELAIPDYASLVGTTTSATQATVKSRNADGTITAIVNGKEVTLRPKAP